MREDKNLHRNISVTNGKLFFVSDKKTRKLWTISWDWMPTEILLCNMADLPQGRHNLHTTIKLQKQKKQAIWYEAKKFLRNFYSSATCTCTRLWIVSCSSYYIVTSLSRNPRGQYTICDMTFVLSIKSNLFAQSINHR